MAQRLVILGGGESGVGTAILGKKQGYDVFVSDFGKIKAHYKEVLLINKIEWEEETHTEDLVLSADIVMKSPGIPDKSPMVKKLVQKGIPVISEIEFAAPFTKRQFESSQGRNVLRGGGMNRRAGGYYRLATAGFSEPIKAP